MVVVVVDVGVVVAELVGVFSVVRHLLLHERVLALEAGVRVGRGNDDRLLAGVGDRRGLDPRWSRLAPGCTVLEVDS